MKRLYFIFLLVCTVYETYAIHYVELDTCKMSIQVLCTQQSTTSSIWNDFVEYIDDFTNDFEQSVYSDIVDNDYFWDIAHRMICFSYDENNELQHAKLMADLQKYISNVDAIPVSYVSNLNKQQLRLSGKIYIPRNGIAKNIIIAHHYTIGANREAPSQTYTFESLLAAKGYVVIMPDYLGFGLTKDSIHPYLNAKLTAQSSVDLLIASIPFLHHRNVHISSPQLILCGYSQGASASLATQRLLETSYPEFIVAKNYVGAGPYSPSDTYDYCIEHDITNIPCAIPMLLQGMLKSEHLNYVLEDFLLPPLLNYYDVWINSKFYTINQINNLIGSQHINEILTPLARNKSLFPTNTFYAALQRNKIDGWTPCGEIYLFHSQLDDMVPFINSQIMKNYFDSIHFTKFNCDFDDYGTHMEAALIFYKRMYQLL